MKAFDDFKLDSADLIFGGDLHATYVGRNGDYYDDDKGRYIFL